MKTQKNLDYTTLNNWLIDTKGSNKKLASAFFQNEQYWLDSINNNDVYITRNYYSKEMCYKSRIKLALRIFKEFDNARSVSIYQTLIYKDDCYSCFDFVKKHLLPYSKINEIIKNINNK